jgi:citrate synthase
MSDALGQGARLMGFGHRVYRVRDPRANVLKAAVAKLKSRQNRIAFAEEVEAAALRALRSFKSERRLDTNVEFYTALLLEALDIPRVAFTPVFALSRTLGWIAHAREQEATGRLMRPQSRYVGPTPVRAA